MKVNHNQFLSTLLQCVVQKERGVFRWGGGFHWGVIEREQRGKRKGGGESITDFFCNLIISLEMD